MKANILFFFSYQEKPENEQDKAVSKLLMRFVDFCDRTDFEFQVIPRLGESVMIHDFVYKWLEDEQPDNPATRQMFYQALKTGDFKVFSVVHSLESCTIHCDEKIEEIE